MTSQTSTIGTQFAQALGRALTDIDSGDSVIESGQWCSSQWQCFHQLGATQLLTLGSGSEASEPAEGATSLDDLMKVAAELGEHNAAFPGIEAIVAAWLLTSIDIDEGQRVNILTGTTTIAIAGESVATAAAAGAVDDAHTLEHVPWGRYANTVLYIQPEPLANADHPTTKTSSTTQAGSIESPRAASLTVLDIGAAQRDAVVTAGQNIAGEARDRIRLPAQSTTVSKSQPCPLPFDHLVALLALAKAAQMTGAMQRIVQLSADYVSQRQQFGRPLSRFQAIQHNLASMYAETITATVATRAALRGDVMSLSLFDASAAIVRARESATRVAALAHQAHGAMGFTDDYALAGYTRRLWAWRDEYDSEHRWQQRLGRLVLRSDQSLLTRLTETSG